MGSSHIRVKDAVKDSLDELRLDNYICGELNKDSLMYSDLLDWFVKQKDIIYSNDVKLTLVHNFLFSDPTRAKDIMYSLRDYLGARYKDPKLLSIEPGKYEPVLHDLYTTLCAKLDDLDNTSFV